jgi:hypothetical protein
VNISVTGGGKDVLGERGKYVYYLCLEIVIYIILGIMKGQVHYVEAKFNKCITSKSNIMMSKIANNLIC